MNTPCCYMCFPSAGFYLDRACDYDLLLVIVLDAEVLHIDSQIGRLVLMLACVVGGHGEDNLDSFVLRLTMRKC